MPFDWRELIFRDMMALDPDDPYYFTKRFTKAKLLLSEEDFNLVKDKLVEVLNDLGLNQFKLRFLEERIKGHAGLKLRGDATIRKISKNKLLSKLAEIDSELDVKLKMMAPAIRWSGSLETRSKPGG